MALQYLQCDDHVVEPEMALKYQKRKKLLEKYRRESDPRNREMFPITFRHVMLLLTIID